MRPERLSAKRSKAAKRLGQVSWLKELLDYYSLEAVSSSLITVARPHGIFTRFPILPIHRGTQMLSNTKNSQDRRGRYHAFDGSVKYLPGVADGKQSRGRERLRPLEIV